MNIAWTCLKWATRVICAIAVMAIAILIYPSRAHALSWSQVNSDGFGSAGNWGTLTLHIFGNYIYAGVGNNSGAQVYRSTDGTIWEQVVSDGFGDANNDWVGDLETYRGQLYASTYKPTGGGAEIWRSATGNSGSWSQVNTDGFGDQYNLAVEAMTVFGDDLYAGTFYNSATGGEIWRTNDGTNWLQVNTDGFGDGSATQGVRSFKIFSGKLYAGAYNASGAKLFRSSEGTNWEAVVNDGFADANNDDIVFLEEFAGNLYAGTINTTSGTELWRSSTGNSGSFTQVNTDGFGSANNIWTSYHGAVINGTFWLGTRNETSGGGVFRSSDGTTWQQESSYGFGDPANFAMYAITFKDRIYLGFANTTTGIEIWRSELLSILSLGPDTLPTGTVGFPYGVLFTGNSGTQPYSFSLSGSLPEGLRSTGTEITGTPLSASTYEIRITITDSGTPQQTVTRTYQLIIDPLETSAVATYGEPGSLVKPKELPETGAGQTGRWWLVIGGIIWLLPLLLIYLVRSRKISF